MKKTQQKKTYRVDYERNESGHWTATIDHSQGVSCVTQGRGLAQARKRIREALALALDDERAAQTAELVENFDLPAKVSASVKACAEARAQADASAQRALEASAKAAKQLASDGMSCRDAAALLGLSFQRVHQLVGTAGGRGEGSA